MGRPGTTRSTNGRRVVALALVAIALPWVGSAAAAPGNPGRASASSVSSSATGVIPTAIRNRYLARTPGLGPVTVVDVSNESTDRKLLASTLEGTVNRTTARIYLVGMRTASEDQHWLDDYVSRGLITIAAHVDLDTALATFHSEVAGYVLADRAQPWTINTATSVAGVDGGVVVTPDTLGAAQAAGITQIADHRNRWTDAPTAYEAIAAQYRSKLAYRGVAIEQTDANNPRDFFVQQGILTIYTRPTHPDFDRLYKLIETYPSTHPVYGYVSDTGDEETSAVARLAVHGRFLVPTDTTDNLSFHVAVGATAARTVAQHPSVADVAPCSSADTNVVIAMSDGDNQVIPEAYYPRSDRFGSSRRGDVPVGWGLSPATAVLMPSVWDRYAGSTTTNDELVDMMGLGYSYPSVMPKATGVAYLADGQRLAAALGLDSHWSLDALISSPGAGGWSMIGAANRASGLDPGGLLLNYEDYGGPPWFHSPDGTPVVLSQRKSYDSTAADLATAITTLAALPASKRPLVNLFPATVWNASFDQLADALAPLQAAGVRFLTPAQAFACLPKPAVVPTSTTTTTDSGSGRSTSVPGDDGAGAAPAGAAPAVPGIPTYTG